MWRQLWGSPTATWAPHSAIRRATDGLRDFAAFRSMWSAKVAQGNRHVEASAAGGKAIPRACSLFTWPLASPA